MLKLPVPGAFLARRKHLLLPAEIPISIGIET
jgi:hypothetical protein